MHGIRHQPEGGRAIYCQAGVNFLLLGEDRLRCDTCALNAVKDKSPCEHLEVYTFLERDHVGQEAVLVELSCILLDKPLSSLNDCGSCPHYQMVQSWLPATIALQAAAPQV